jgi:SAM-dependent methyltransferase
MALLTRQNFELLCTVLAERLEGLDFTTQMLPAAAGLDPALANTSQPSGGPHLEAVLDEQPISAWDSIIDIGCGKGSAMRTMLSHPFARVDGIEMSRRLAGIARRNFALLGQSRATVYSINAEQFSGYDRYSFFYFYNPFPKNVMTAVMGRICDSLRRAPRRAILIYDNPVCHDEIIRGGLFRKKSEYPDAWGNRIFVYTDR